MTDWQRTVTCGELREANIGQVVTLNGWVNSTRSYNDQVFIDLRDRYGITQVVIEADRGAERFAAAQDIRDEWVLSVRGTVRERLPDKHNPKLLTGDVEVLADEVNVLNRCPTPPFEVMSIPTEGKSFSDPQGAANEDLRLQYRYLDLRRPSVQQALQMRHKLCKVMRDYLDGQGFLEIETPLLGRSTPEGARDYLVPSRVHPGQFYALPQSPQLYKQLLMVAGYDKYFQIARCLRDEDLRADRQPEFTQLDVEMSFVETDDIFRVMEGLTAEIYRRCLGLEINLPLQRLPYAEAMAKYGSDKPDLRYGLEIVDVTAQARQSTFKVFLDTVERGGVVRGINAKGAAAKFSNTDLKPGGKLAEFVAQFGAKGLAWFKVEGDKLVSSIEKFFPAPVQDELKRAMNAASGDVLLFVADTPDVAAHALGGLRQHLAQQLGLIDPAKRDFKILWVVDFPSFIWDEDEKRWVANHHPFTAPQDQYLDVLKSATEDDLRNPKSKLGEVKAKAYVLVINGYECAGGSIRIHNPEIQQALFRVLGMTPEQAQGRFGFLLDALKFGAPPHGGIALGVDRWAMLLSGTTNIRDVIAFPKNQKARDVMTGAPANVDAKQLRDLGIKI
jgi:aspartyl-tRNA synthetase